jgi:cytochrome c
MKDHMIGNFNRSVSACAGLLLAGAAFFSVAVFSVPMSGAAKPGDAAKGMDIFSSNCDVCHNTDSVEPKVGPGLKGLFKRANLNNKKKVSEATVMELINKGSPVGMPAFEDQLSEQERADVLAYLKTL